MPELPEVETVRIGLAGLLPGARVTDIKSDWSKSFPNDQSDTDTFLIGAVVTGVRRRAKVLLIDLDSGYSLVIHLKMTGQLVYVRKPEVSVVSSQESVGSTENRKLNTDNSAPEERFGAGHPGRSLAGSLPDKSTRVILYFETAILFFNDQRKFGWMRLIPTIEVEQLDFFKKVGPEPLAADFSAQDFIVRIRRRYRSIIKAVLLDQTVIAGVGNIYADESLWGARLHPATPVQNIPDAQLKRLFKELQYVLNLAIEKGGSTDRNYVNAEGKRGSYLSFARVFRRENRPCPRCGHTIVKLRVAGRGTHVCPRCQQESMPKIISEGKK